MRAVSYWPSAERLVYLDRKATPEFWSDRWRAEGKPARIGPRDDVVRITRKYLPSGARVLEGGCGRANKVKAIADAGFSATGVDFAKESVQQARRDYPDLDLRQGDVRKLDFPDGYFDGYWSIGVIEHFWEGYGDILSEAARVLKPHGLLFLSAPWFSPLRRSKARKGGYPAGEFQAEPEGFYQFALGRSEVCHELARIGFEVVEWMGRAPEISMKEDVHTGRRAIHWLLADRPSIPKRLLRRMAVKIMQPFCGHSFLAVARRSA